MTAFVVRLLPFLAGGAPPRPHSASTALLPVPTRPDRLGGRLDGTCLIASEISAAAGAKLVVWRLLTNRTAAPLDAVELIDWHHARWEIELLFLILQEGCRDERLQLSDTKRLRTA